MLSCGKRIIDICDKYAITPYDLSKIMGSDTLFSQAIDDARKIATFYSVDSMMSIIDAAESYIDVQKAKMKVDVIKWIAARHNSKVYGDRTDINVTQTLDLGPILGAALERIAPALHHESNAIDISPVKSIDYADVSTGSTPVLESPRHKKRDKFDDLL